MKPDNVYHLYAKIEGVWHWLGNIYAPTYADAQRQAIASLDAKHYDKPIRLDYDQDAPTNCGMSLGQASHVSNLLKDHAHVV